MSSLYPIACIKEALTHHNVNASIDPLVQTGAVHGERKGYVLVKRIVL